MNVRPRRRTRNARPNGNKRNALAAQVIKQRLSFDAVGMDGYVQRLPMIEAQPVVCGGLSQRAHRQRLAELQTEESFHLLPASLIAKWLTPP